jgi:hypothetical protein
MVRYMTDVCFLWIISAPMFINLRIEFCDLFVSNVHYGIVDLQNLMTLKPGYINSQAHDTGILKIS